MSEHERATRTVSHDGREFRIAAEERYAGVATGGIGRITVLFWTIATDGYPPCQSDRVVDPDPDDSFFERLVAKEWPLMQAAGATDR